MVLYEVAQELGLTVILRPVYQHQPESFPFDAPPDAREYSPG